MNVVILNDYACVQGGATKVAVDEALELSNQGHDVFYFSAVGPVSDDLLGSKVNVICLDQHDLVSNPNRFAGSLQGLWNFKAASELKRVLTNLDKRDTIVHLHGWTKALSSSVVRVSRQMGFRIVYTFHDFFSYCPNGGRYNYRTRECCNLKPLNIKCLLTDCDSRSHILKLYRILRQLVQSLVGGIPAKMDACISISNITDECLRKMKHDFDVYSLKNPIEVSSCGSLDLKDRDYYLYIGRVSPEKGVDIFCEGCSEAGVKGVVVGDGLLKEDYENKYPDMAFLGWLDSEDVARKIMSAKMLVLPSRLTETFGLVVYEALSLGVPCLVASHTAAADAIIDGVNGFKFGNVNDLILRMNEVENDPNLLESLSGNTYENFRQQNLDVRSHVIELSKIYTRILNK